MYYRIDARRWFQSSYGNTYHSCRVSKCEGEGDNYHVEEVGTVQYTYGYGESWKQTAFEIMDKAGELPDDVKEYHDFLKWANSDKVAFFVKDVAKKRELYFN